MYYLFPYVLLLQLITAHVIDIFLFSLSMRAPQKNKAASKEESDDCSIEEGQCEHIIISIGGAATEQ